MFPDAMYTFEGRLASFKLTRGPKRRASSRRGSALKAPAPSGWFHITPSAEQLAKAGFLYAPLPDSSDNVTCFLCHKSLDGWEAEDDPIREHLTHSPDCGWAIIVGTLDKREEPLATLEDPMSDEMNEARRATFAGKWPHDGKKGWACSTEKMVTGGWYYCPKPESEDFVSCAYCSLSVDGWEPKDKPLDEHRRGAPNCPFFTLSKPLKTRQKSSRVSRAGRNSTASRLSTLSIATAVSEVPTLMSVDGEDGDSVSTILTAATSAPKATAGGKKKGGRPKKAATATAATKSKRGAAKKETPPEPAPEPEIIAAVDTIMIEAEDDDFEVKIQAKPARATRGRKRKSEQMDADETNEVTQDPQKKRKSSTLIVEKVIDTTQEPNESAEIAMLDSPQPIVSPPRPAPKKRETKTKNKTSDEEEAPKPKKRVVSRAKPKKEPAPIEPAKEATPAPEPTPASPQMSDAENQPPSAISRSSLIHPARKTGTPIVVSTPLSQRFNARVIEGQPTLKWTTTDVETIFLKSPSSRQVDEQDKENLGSQALSDTIAAVGGALQSPERSMTVEQWIRHSADLGEQRMRADCERLVGLFEREGNRALQALEGIPIVGQQ